MNEFECPLSLNSRKNPHKVALISKEKTLTYQKSHELTSLMYLNLNYVGIKEGEKVAIYPHIEWITPLIFFSLFRLKAVVCPLNIRLPLLALSMQLSELQASYLLCPDSFKTLPSTSIKSLFFSELIKPSRNSISDMFLDKNQVSTFLYTSGTAGKPKIAIHSLGNHYYSALGSNAYLPFTDKDRWLLSLPLFHVGGIGILFRSFLKGAAVVLPDQKRPLINSIIQYAVSHLSCVPTQVYRLLKEDALTLRKATSSLRCILLGGGPISLSLLKEGIQAGLSLFPTYGMTEMSSQITTQLNSSPLNISLGHPLPYRMLKIAPNGEILVKGKTLFQGYLNPSHEGERQTDPQGWFSTKDLGSYSLKRGLTIQGRKDRLFISGGENIQPEEIENILLECKTIITAHVCPIQDQEFGLKPIAYIQTKDSYSKEMLFEYLSSFLPKFKIPVDFLPLSEMPVSPQKKDSLLS